VWIRRRTPRLFYVPEFQLGKAWVRASLTSTETDPNCLLQGFSMTTAAWKGFIHSWHTLGIVLKWMCITVVGIPFAIATCILVAAAVLAFALACLAVAAGACAGVFYMLKGALWVLLRIPFWISEFRIHRAERRVFVLPVSQPRPIQQIRLRPGVRVPIFPRRPIVPAPPGTIVHPQIPPPAHVAQEASTGGASGPATALPGTMECQVCLEHKLLDEFPQRNPTETCSHAVACCITCLSQTITAAFEGRMWYDIRCPICNNELKHEDVAEFATQDIFQK